MPNSYFDLLNYSLFAAALAYSSLGTLSKVMQELGCAMPHSVFNLAEQCHIHEFFIWLKMKTTPVVLIQDFITNNAGAWLSTATLRFFCWAEQCHTHEILIWQKKMKTTKKMNTNSNAILTSKIKTTYKINVTQKGRRPQKWKWPQILRRMKMN